MDQHCVIDAEHGGIRADTYSQAQNADDYRNATVFKSPKSVSDIGYKPVHWGQLSSLAISSQAEASSPLHIRAFSHSGKTPTASRWITTPNLGGARADFGVDDGHYCPIMMPARRLTLSVSTD
jgi:hypothetical protein